MDFQLHQAVRETETLAADREGGEWARLRASLRAVADALGRDRDDAAYDRRPDRLRRGRLHDSPRDHVVGDTRGGDLQTPSSVVAALYAVYDQPTDEHAARAADALERLHDALAPQAE